MDEPRRRHDPLTLAVIGGAVLVLVVLVVGLVLSIRSAPPAAPAAPKAAPTGPSLGERISELTRQVAKEITAAVREDRPMKMPGTAKPPAPKPQAPLAAAKLPPSAVGSGMHATRLFIQPLQPGRTFRYRVSVEPQTWRNAALTYRTVSHLKGIAVYTEFTHAAGKSNFQLGIYEAGHSSHPNMRFPGFFMYPAYLKLPLHLGEEIEFGWHWQGMSAASAKRFKGRIGAETVVQTPLGAIRAVHILGTWTYTEDGQFRGRANEELWFAPEYGQIVKIVRSGIAPDERSAQIIAELVEFR